MGDKCGDKCKFMRPKAPRVRDKCGRQGGDKCKLMWQQGNQSGRQVWKTRVGDKCKLMRPKAEWEASVGDKWDRSVNSCETRHPVWETSVGDKWKTSVNSCGPRHPVADPGWETRGRQV